MSGYSEGAITRFMCIRGHRPYLLKWLEAFSRNVRNAFLITQHFPKHRIFRFSTFSLHRYFIGLMTMDTICNEKTCINSMVNLLWKTFYGKHIMVKVHRTTREVVNFGILEGLAGAGVELGYDTI